MRITVHNRGPEPASLHLLPTLWFRNTWSWGGDAARPGLRDASGDGSSAIAATHPELGAHLLRCTGEPELLFTENETNTQRLFGVPNRTPYVKDAIDRYLVDGDIEAVNPERAGTKATAHYPLTVDAGGSVTVRLRLSAIAELPPMAGQRDRT